MVCTVDYAMAVFPGLPFLYCWVLQFLLCWQQPSCNCGPRHLRFMSPSNVAWTEENLAIASNGDAFRGSLLVKRCDHCHGVEGFMRPAYHSKSRLPRPACCLEELQGFHYGKQISPVMQPIAAILSARDSADLAAYYSMLPTFPGRKIIAAFLRPRPIRLRQIGQRSWLL